MQHCIKILLFHIYMKFNMFLATNCHHQEPKTTLESYGFYRYFCLVVDFSLNLELFLQNTRT